MCEKVKHPWTSEWINKQLYIYSMNYWFMQQHEWISNALRQVTEARINKLHSFLILVKKNLSKQKTSLLATSWGGRRGWAKGCMRKLGRGMAELHLSYFVRLYTERMNITICKLYPNKLEPPPLIGVHVCELALHKSGSQQIMFQINLSRTVVYF